MKTSSCSTCFHPQAREINRDLANNVAHKKIAAKYGLAANTISNHRLNCLKKSTPAVRALKRADAAFDYGKELLKNYYEMRDYAEAFKEWLTDPDDAEKFFIGERDVELMIVYQDWKDLNERGKPTRKKARLSDLLQIIEGTGREVMAVQSLAKDNRQMYLECFKAIGDSLQTLGRFLGLWKQEPQKTADIELEKLRLIIQASADEHNVTFDEEARIFFALPVAQTVRADIRAKLISDLEQ